MIGSELAEALEAMESEQPELLAAIKLMAWRHSAGFLDKAALEFVNDAATTDYLQHVAVCVRDEGERKYAAQAGFDPALAG